MDNTDLDILNILKKNSRLKYVKIAEIIGLTEGAIRRRIKKMVKQEIIKRFTIETHTEFEGIVLIETKPTRTKETVLKIRDIAYRIYEVSGDYDIAALINAHKIDELNKKIDEIRKLPEVQHTKTLIKLN
jgi:Lrp/AsnC family transcriptional regulator of lysine biosynthesis